MLLLTSLGWGVRNMLRDAPVGPAGGGSRPPLSAADQRQEEILKLAIDQPPDPALGRAYDDVNTRHFGGLLPSMPVIWEPRLAQVGTLASGAFTLEGMFGHIGEKAVILLNPSLARDQDALRRALSHEMVHAYLYTIGDQTTGHGPAFQATLRRLANEGAFTGVVATAQERESLRNWIEEESARLDAESERTRREGEVLVLEARDLEQAFASLNTGSESATPASALEQATVMAAWTSRRDDHNQRVDALRARTERARADLASFNEQVARYNLMLSYPDGLDRHDVLADRR